MDSGDGGVFTRDKADVTIIELGKDVIRILSDDIDVFVMLVYWVCKIQLHCNGQMERWNGVVVDIHEACSELGPKCLQLMGMHVLNGCETVSYPINFNKGKISTVKNLQAGDFPGLYQVLGEEDAARQDLMETGRRFIAVLHGLPLGTTMNEACYKEDGKAYTQHGIATDRSEPIISMFA